MPAQNALNEVKRVITNGAFEPCYEKGFESWIFDFYPNFTYGREVPEIQDFISEFEKTDLNIQFKDKLGHDLLERVRSDLKWLTTDEVLP